jgi:hypothetical protein
MFNSKLITFHDSSKEAVRNSMTAFLDLDTRIRLQSSGQMQHAIDFLSAHQSKVKDEALVNRFEQLSGVDWESRLERDIKDRKRCQITSTHSTFEENKPSANISNPVVPVLQTSIESSSALPQNDNSDASSDEKHSYLGLLLVLGFAGLVTASVIYTSWSDSNTEIKWRQNQEKLSQVVENPAVAKLIKRLDILKIALEKKQKNEKNSVLGIYNADVSDEMWEYAASLRKILVLGINDSHADKLAAHLLYYYNLEAIVAQNGFYQDLTNGPESFPIKAVVDFANKQMDIFNVNLFLIRRNDENKVVFGAMMQALIAASKVRQEKILYAHGILKLEAPREIRIPRQLERNIFLDEMAKKYGVKKE